MNKGYASDIIFDSLKEATKTIKISRINLQKMRDSGFATTHHDRDCGDADCTGKIIEYETYAEIDRQVLNSCSECGAYEEINI